MFGEPEDTRAGVLVSRGVGSLLRNNFIPASVARLRLAAL
jgi:hypothetical protein